MMRWLVLFGSLFLSVSCTGYRWGEERPVALKNIQSIYIEMLTNGTLHPRAEAMATAAVVDAFVQDGTYRVTSRNTADAVLTGKITRIGYSNARGNRLDTLRAEEFQNNAEISWTLSSAKQPIRVIASGQAKASSQFFVDSNLQTARNNALPDVFERAAIQLVARLTHGM